MHFYLNFNEIHCDTELLDIMSALHIILQKILTRKEIKNLI